MVCYNIPPKPRKPITPKSPILTMKAPIFCGSRVLSGFQGSGTKHFGVEFQDISQGLGVGFVVWGFRVIGFAVIGCRVIGFRVSSLGVFRL